MSSAGTAPDVLVLGAGIVGVCTALHLQARGRSVVLVDKHSEAGRETSYGNAGIIERSSVRPYMFPRDLATIVRVALNRSVDVRYHANALREVLPWLAQYFVKSSPAGIERTARAALPLIERSVVEHEALMAAAGAEHLASRTGWIKLYRTRQKFDSAIAEVARLAPYQLDIEVMDRARLAQVEPHVSGGLGGVHFRDSVCISDPAALSKAYADLFAARGGLLVRGDALTLAQHSGGWCVATESGLVSAREAVVALGPWSAQLLRPLGYRIPLGIKRGYHLHFGAAGNAVLNRPVLDEEAGYLLAPMQQGIRLTTGAEFARFGAPCSPVQIALAEPLARKMFPLAERRDGQPWMGRRPCLPDMLPLIGPALRHRGLWLNFGHQHHGLTLGPVTGRLLAQMMTGEELLADPAPYALERFG